jgi:hypothetical protein
MAMLLAFEVHELLPAYETERDKLRILIEASLRTTGWTATGIHTTYSHPGSSLDPGADMVAVVAKAREIVKVSPRSMVRVDYVALSSDRSSVMTGSV